MLLASRFFVYIFCFLLALGVNAEDASIVIPNSASEGQSSNLIFSAVFHKNTDYVFYPDSFTSILIGVHNTGESDCEIVSIGASLSLISSPSAPIKMFRPNDFKQPITGNTRGTIEYYLFIDNLIIPQDYVLSVYANYTEDGRQGLSSIICQKEIKIVDTPSYADWIGLCMLLAITAVILYFTHKPLKVYFFRLLSYFNSFKPRSRKKAAAKRAN